MATHAKCEIDESGEWDVTKFLIQHSGADDGCQNQQTPNYLGDEAVPAIEKNTNWVGITS